MAGRRAPLSAAVLALGALCAGAALAQTAPSRIVPPNRPDQQPPEPPAPAETPPPRRQPAPAPPQVAPFKVASVEVAGSTLPPTVLIQATQPFVGRTLDAAGLQQLSDAVAQAYAKSDIGLYTVIVPEQDFKAGVVHLTAIEGFVQDVVVDGPQDARHRALIDRYVDKMRRERPLTRRSLQRYVSLIRDIPGLRPEVDLVSGDRQGAVKVRVKTRPRTVQAGLGVNNRGTAYLGRTQVQGDVYLSSLATQGDQLRLTAAAPTEKNLFRYYAASYSAPIAATGATLQANAGYLRTRPANTGLKGRARSAGVQVAYPVVRGFDRNLYVTLGLDGLNSDNAFLGYTFSDDRTRAIRASLAYSRIRPKSFAAASAAVSRGLKGLGARTGDPNLAKLAFTKVNGRLAFNRQIAKPLILRLAAAGQYSHDRLPGSEQFALGGEEFGRAYEASIIAGDYGYAGSVELAFRPQGLPDAVAGSEAYGFLDGGKVWHRGRYGLPTASQDLESAGAGLRIAVKQKAVIQLEAAKGLTQPVYYLDRKRWRGVFSVKSLF
jgi:hemolysin activation/secretion protein